MAEYRATLESCLKDLSITYQMIEHSEVFTVEAMMPYLKDIEGLVVKNLFLKDKKKKKLWLVTALHDQEINLGKLSKHLKLGGLRFADEAVMIEKLKVKQGCVTPLALLFDKDVDVNFVLDKSLVLDDETSLFCHPMVNSATVGMSFGDFKRFLTHTKHEMKVVDFEQVAAS